MADCGREFLDASRDYLLRDFLPRIENCVAELTDEDIWWRPNESSNSIGNLLLHLSGNVRQWITSGVGGAPDTRERQREFDERDTIPAADVLGRLAAAVEEAAAVLEQCPVEILDEEREIQGTRGSVLQAIYHVIEHFSMHTGQIIYITKLRRGRDLGFYRVAGGIAKAQWSGRDP